MEVQFVGGWRAGVAGVQVVQVLSDCAASGRGRWGKGAELRGGVVQRICIEIGGQGPRTEDRAGQRNPGC